MYRREPDKETPVTMGGKVWYVPRLSKEEVREASRVLNSLAHDQARQDEAMTDIYPAVFEFTRHHKAPVPVTRGPALCHSVLVCPYFRFGV